MNFYHEGKLDKALDQFTKAIEKDPTQLDYYFNRAMVLVKLDQIDEVCKGLLLIKDF
ncbi:tetratricopeptide repeat protein [Fulvivirga sp. 29W222]|uniref:Tetratricopeptide repeat protein n=1 Tax=Fulvivirga marina TaxID=2494733 RepID=A0A937G0B4_9BACT|nr:tetratricopeptide repeat protein [Fulvivirga marina]